MNENQTIKIKLNIDTGKVIRFCGIRDENGFFFFDNGFFLLNNVVDNFSYYSGVYRLLISRILIRFVYTCWWNSIHGSVTNFNRKRTSTKWKTNVRSKRHRVEFSERSVTQCFVVRFSILKDKKSVHHMEKSKLNNV